MIRDETIKYLEERNQREKQAKEKIIRILKDNNFSISYSEKIFGDIIYQLRNTPLNDLKILFDS